jgi:type VI secretion system protein ImpL
MRWLAIILVSVILLAVWIAAIFFPELWWVATLVTAAVVGLILAVFLIRWASKRLKARAIERAMAKQSDSEAPEIAALRNEMQSAVRALRQRQGAGGGRAALYGLPWYVIIGPPAVGKTTAFEKSGLSFVPSAAGAPKIRGSAGTRNCDWWFAHEAILLDTAGRFATHDNDREEWLAFLDVLHRVRPERPLDGLLVAVSLPDVLAKSETEREELAAKLRERIDEVHSRLEMVLPVYLLLTKVDLVAGFAESWADLGKPQRSQVWGASFDLDDPRLEEAGGAVEAEFDVLVEGLHARLLERIPAERDGMRRARIMQFPLEVRAARSPLAQFVEALCQPSGDGQRLRLRGFYLTSAVQVGRPIERVLSGMMRGFDVQDRSASVPSPQRETHSYFLTDLFKKVILADVGVAMRSAQGVERRSRRELRAALLALGVAAFILFPATVSYVRNIQLAHDVGRTARILKAGAASTPGASADPIESMLDTLDRLDSEAAGFGIPGWFGPRAARALREPLRRTYVGRIHAALRGRLEPELTRELGNVAKARRLDDSIDSPEDRTPLRKAYEAVKLYALLVDPVDHIELPWSAEQLASAWQRTLPGGVSVDRPRLVRHATNYLRALAADATLRWPAPPSLQEARVHLKEVGVEQLPYHWVLRRAYDQPPVLASDVADAPSLKYLTCPAEQELVPRHYTASAWQKIAGTLDSKERWPPEAFVERWALADMRIPVEEKALRAEVREQYYADYSARWLAMLDKCAVSRPGEFKGSQDELTALKGSKGFYKTLFSQFNANAIADEKKDLLPIPLPLTTEGCAAKFSSARLDASASAAQPKAVSPVQKSFEPLLEFSGDAEDSKKPAPLEKYLTILENLRATLEAASDAPGGPDPRPEFARARRGVEALLDGLQEPIKGKLNRLLLPPVEGTIKVTETGRTDSMSAEWEKKVWSAWDGKLRRVFPFSGTPAVREAAAFEDFRSFFQPDGILWGFFKANLADSVELTDSGYKPKPASTPPAPDLLSCLSIAQEVSDAFFPAGEDPGLRFSLQIDWSATDVTESKFYIAEKPTVLPKSQWSAPLKWNGESVRLEWVQGGRPTQEIGRHSFSLFDLFEQLGGLKPSPGGRRGLYEVEFAPLVLKVRADGKSDPFRAAFFTRLRCPQELRSASP